MASIEQQLAIVLVAQPLNAVKDPDILNRLKNAFEEQIKEVKRKASEDPRRGEEEIVVPEVPMPDTRAVENENVHGTSTKAPRKRGRMTTTKLVFRVPFSFETPKFCLDENINLEMVLLNRFLEGASSDKRHLKLPVRERLQHWILEKRERGNNEGDNKKSQLHDHYFYHTLSKLKLRSQPEVINFLIDGHVPMKGGSKKGNLAEVAIVDNDEALL